MLVHKKGDIYFNFASPPRPDILRKDSEPDMVSNVIVINIEALCDRIVEFLLFLRIPHPQKRNRGDGQHHFRLGLQDFIFGLDQPYSLGKVAFHLIGLGWGHFQHPSSILEHQGEIQIFVFLAELTVGQNQLVFFVKL